MGASTSKQKLVGVLGRVSLPPLVCVCCDSTYIENTDGNEESLGETAAPERAENVEPWIADSADDPERG